MARGPELAIPSGTQHFARSAEIPLEGGLGQVRTGDGTDRVRSQRSGVESRLIRTRTAVIAGVLKRKSGTTGRYAQLLECQSLGTAHQVLGRAPNRGPACGFVVARPARGYPAGGERDVDECRRGRDHSGRCRIRGASGRTRAGGWRRDRRHSVERCVHIRSDGRRVDGRRQSCRGTVRSRRDAAEGRPGAVRRRNGFVRPLVRRRNL